jgi:chorismate mutase
MFGRILGRLLGVPTVRALRGAITVTDDAPEAIAFAVTEMLDELRRENGLRDHEVISAIFTMTPDLTTAFPAAAARGHGWNDVPLLCATEVAVPGSMPRCLRVLVHVERSWRRRPAHVYLREARQLRPDWNSR